MSPFRWLCRRCGVGLSQSEIQLDGSGGTPKCGCGVKAIHKRGSTPKTPIQLDISFSKRFKKLPVTISVTAHNLQVWNLKFPEEETQNIFLGTTKKNNKALEVVDNIFRHFSFGVEVQAGKPVRLRLGYNHLRRQTGSGEEKRICRIFSKVWD